MMAQYLTLKAKAPDCLLFYRMGDFFELFFEDAKVAAGVLDIALTARGEHDGQPVPMCGVPVHSATGYLDRLIRAGHRVAIAEQTETPSQARSRGGAKALVARDVIRLVTAGTLTEESLLDARADNWCASIGHEEGRVAVAAADISTGRFVVIETDAAMLGAELARLQPAEVITAEDCAFKNVATALRARTAFDSSKGEAKLKRLYGVATLDGYGSFDRASLAAAAGLIDYFEHTARGALPFLRPPTLIEAATTMSIDAATRASLELTRTMAGERRGSLLDAVDRTVTGAGARMLAGDIAAPLMSDTEIRLRIDLVTFFFEDGSQRAELRTALRSLSDIGRALGRLTAGRGSPRDLGHIRDGLDTACKARMRLMRGEGPELLRELVQKLTGHAQLIDLLKRALVATPTTDVPAGGYIAPGYDEALDELRETGANGRQTIAALQSGLRAQTGIASLKVRHNNVLGYHIEVPVKAADLLMEPESGFTHRQTLAGAVRFNTTVLIEVAGKIAQAGAHAQTAEIAHYEQLTSQVLKSSAEIAATADALARLDVASGLAERAEEGGWIRPAIVDENIFEVADGWHPVVASALAKSGGRFVANACTLDDSSRLWLVTGPNMGGKSTFLRQNALIAVLAQAGSYVPAQSARLGLVDRLFSRVGAADNLALGRSTFMVEMVETAAILTQATPRSFVILDEVGRGTSTYDGLAIAWAVAEAIHDDNRCRCLFATHYHELTRLAERCDALSLHHVRAREWKGDLVLLHEVAAGPADRSYGLAVARLAGMPRSTVDRARAILAKLEVGRMQTGGLAAGLDDLPLFAAAELTDKEERDSVRETIAALDIDAMTPRDALEALYRLKTLATND